MDERDEMQRLAHKLAVEVPWVAVSHRDFYEQMVDAGYFIVTPDGIVATVAYERFDDGSPFT